MAQLDEQSWQVVAAAQRYVKTGDPSELRGFSLVILKKAEYQLGERDLNAGWRKAIQDFIAELANAPDVLEVKPEAFGIKLNVNEVLRRVVRWFRCSS